MTSLSQQKINQSHSLKTKTAPKTAKTALFRY